jgi:hypothetical protein
MDGTIGIVHVLERPSVGVILMAGIIISDGDSTLSRAIIHGIHGAITIHGMLTATPTHG